MAPTRVTGLDVSCDLIHVMLAVEMLLNHRDLSLQDADVLSEALRHYRKWAKVGFSDCLVLEIARKAGHLPLAAFDRDFAKPRCRPFPRGCRDRKATRTGRPAQAGSLCMPGWKSQLSCSSRWT